MESSVVDRIGNELGEKTENVLVNGLRSAL